MDRRIIASILCFSILLGNVPTRAEARGRMSTGTKIAIGIGIAAGAYLGYRAYEAHKASVAARNAPAYYGGGGGGGGYYYSGDDSSSDDPAYDEYQRKMSEAARKREIEQEFQRQMKRNATMLAKLKETFPTRMAQLEKSEARYVCMAFCGRYHDSTVLEAKIVSSFGNTPKEGLANLDASCDQNLFFDIGPKASQYGLYLNQNACIPNKASVRDMADDRLKEIAGDKTLAAMKFKAAVYSVNILPDGKTVSDEFRAGAIHQAAMITQLFDGKSTFEEALAKLADDLPGALHLFDSLQMDTQRTKPGYSVMTNFGSGAAKVEFIGDGISEPNYGSKTTMQMPMTVAVRCADEVHPVLVVFYTIPVGNKHFKEKQPSAEYLQTLQEVAARGLGSTSAGACGSNGEPKSTQTPSKTGETPAASPAQSTPKAAPAA